ncbi:substrate-binding periplasmic protein [Pseudobacteriovorax antillogorgiicola]|uniref:Amino acid ABC transporter substrate-binding protein, PAAT family n=1 Tax=Pseudobacteriovorax antillogorgiicola TaxID=1513793 RepID=A0A1Y6BSB2_9BACT|nr:transporter substrate-binding domain-containing protein [Pseudobacteriovorax antillogorgiicola]TCS53177.1 amino acid ABC transporter substrate-binding protein (PAAT family) [Pseudobacteriovorax antillogorgiicola]SMF24585.1 amino acid ABC transporter substrate-binding protein, PAAT family [Pseudobacteriovorax antillogorgiicola]
MTLRSLYSSLFFLSALLSSSLLAKSVSMVTLEWEPFYGPKLKNKGVITEIVQEAFERAGHQASIQFLPWKRALAMGEKGEADVVMGAYYSKERADKFHISSPLYDINIRIIGQKKTGITRYNSLKELKKYKIGISRGFANGDEFDAATYLQKQVAKSPELNIKKLINGRLDFVVMAEGIFSYELARYEASHPVKGEFVFLDPILSANKLYILASKKLTNSKKLIDAFNLGLKKIMDDGTYRKILISHGFSHQA